MKKTKKVASLLLLLSLVFVAACSGSSKPAPTSSLAPKATEAAEPNEEKEEPAYDLKGDKIRLAMWWDGAPVAGTELGDRNIERHNEIKKKYNAEIEYINIPWGELEERVTSTVMAGEPFANMVRLDLKWMPGLVAGGYLTPLDEFVDVSQESLLPDSVKSVGKFGGMQYGFVDTFNPSSGIVYNKRMFAEAGLPDPYELQEKGEWTWEQMLSAAKALTKDTDNDGVIDQYGLSFDQAVAAEHFILSNNGKIVDADNGAVAFDSSESMEALHFMNELYNVHKVVKRNEGNDWLDPKNFFTQGQVAMTQAGVWEGEERMKNMTDEWGYVFFPKGPKASDYVVPVTIADMFFIPKGAPHAKESYELWKDLVLWDSLNEGYQDFLETNLPDENSIKTAQAMVNKGRFEGWRGYRFEGEFIEAVLNISNGTEPPATAVERIKQVAQGKIDEILKK
ncbi:extracellular solute-binding protein [Paenibacillus paeoniae]|uniref:Extracellular solute-binding protein n=1 Tax=Paenibacillus paeoniae TaxID=2292705 RepID=A0A371PG06_9BACL|nr:extracellular solute-binding protein [Paenibacillus paeoniae]REK74794.1 extracellular solute-binding protein [Paenibacillus paeoniae]